MKVGIYYRVSTDKQDLDSQRHEVERWVENLPKDQIPQSVITFKDEGFSGKHTRRPGFQELIQAAMTGKIDTIVVYKLDRLSRSATAAIRLLLDLDDAGVAFISVSQPALNLGHTNPFRRTMLSAFAEIAEIERETIVARVRAGLEAAKKKGVKLGAPKKLDAKKAAKAKQLQAGGMSVRNIAAQMKLSVGSVHTMLKSA